MSQSDIWGLQRLDDGRWYNRHSHSWAPLTHGCLGTKAQIDDLYRYLKRRDQSGGPYYGKSADGYPIGRMAKHQFGPLASTKGTEDDD